jgi:hypothetical protein
MKRTLVHIVRRLEKILLQSSTLFDVSLGCEHHVTKFFCISTHLHAHEWYPKHTVSTNYGAANCKLSKAKSANQEDQQHLYKHVVSSERKTVISSCVLCSWLSNLTGTHSPCVCMSVCVRVCVCLCIFINALWLPSPKHCLENISLGFPILPSKSQVVHVLIQIVQTTFVLVKNVGWEGAEGER